MPVGLIALISTGLGMWSLRTKKSSSYGYFLIAFIIWFFSITPVENFLLAPLEYKHTPPFRVAGDVIIALTGGIKEKAPGISGDFSLNGDSGERTFAAVRIYKKTGIPMLVTGGAVFSEISEALVAKRFLMDVGIPEKDIIIEEKSRDTMESAAYSKKICDEKGFKKIILVTSASHMPRAVWSFRKAGFEEITPFPAAYKSSKNPVYYYRDFLPGNLRDSSCAIKEYLGLIFYKIFY